MNSFVVKSGITIFLVLALLVPISMISSLVDERKARQGNVYSHMSTLWGGDNTAVGGLFLSRGSDIVVPDMTEINAVVDVEVRQKGIFKIPFFSAKMVIKGIFENTARLAGKNKINLLVFNNNAIEVKYVKVNGKDIPAYLYANNKIVNANVLSAYNHAEHHGNGGRIEVVTAISIKGIDKLMFQQISKKTGISVTSNWTDPNFTGSLLPAARTIDEKGFRATWEMSEQMSQSGKSLQVLGEENLFGLSLFMPVNIYSLTDRSIKYAILFIGLTFMAYFLFEVFGKLKIHPFQYLLVGFALTIFYLLLLSLSEFLSFALSYFIASSAVIVLITLYSRNMLRARARSIIMGIMLTMLYLFLYILLQLEQYSLLLGSSALFVLLASVMYLTRNINWYELQDS